MAALSNNITSRRSLFYSSCERLIFFECFTKSGSNDSLLVMMHIGSESVTLRNIFNYDLKGSQIYKTDLKSM